MSAVDRVAEIMSATWTRGVGAQLEALAAADPPLLITDAQEKLTEAVIDLCWRVIPYGETDDGDIANYIVSKGTVHRLIGAAQAAGVPAAFRNGAVPAPAEPRLITDEIQAVLDAAVRLVTAGPEALKHWKLTVREGLRVSVDAYLASRGET